MKKVFSLNLISYLKSQGHVANGIGYDEETKNVYYIFDESKEVTQAIRTYKSPEATVNLHEFISNFKNVRKEIRDHLNKQV